MLITLMGRDRPGVTAAMFRTLSASGVEVLDIEQIVLRGRLVLGILVTAPRDAGASSPLPPSRPRHEHGHGRRDRARRRRQPAARERPRARHPARPPAPPQARSPRSPAGSPTPARTSTGSSGWRATRSPRSSSTCPAPTSTGCASVLAKEAAAQQVDVAVQSVGLLRHGRRLIVMDVDSTLVQGEVIDMLAARAGVGDEVAAITEQAMRGELDFEASLRARVALLEGLPVRALDEVYDEPGAGAGRAHVGPHAQAARLPVRDRQRRLHPAHRPAGRRPRHRLRARQRARGRRRAAHRADRRAGRRPGRQGAGAASSSRPTPRSRVDRTVAIGDGANDLDMLAAAGLGIAFNAKPVVQEAAHTAAQRALPRRDPLPARHQPRGHRGRRRRTRHHHTRSPARSPDSCPTRRLRCQRRRVLRTRAASSVDRRAAGSSSAHTADLDSSKHRDA